MVPSFKYPESWLVMWSQDVYPHDVKFDFKILESSHVSVNYFQITFLKQCTSKLWGNHDTLTQTTSWGQHLLTSHIYWQNLFCQCQHSDKLHPCDLCMQVANPNNFATNIYITYTNEKSGIISWWSNTYYTVMTFLSPLCTLCLAWVQGWSHSTWPGDKCMRGDCEWQKHSGDRERVR